MIQASFFFLFINPLVKENYILSAADMKLSSLCNC